MDRLKAGNKRARLKKPEKRRNKVFSSPVFTASRCLASGLTCWRGTVFVLPVVEVDAPSIF
ncbi:hypothetical protein Cabther_A0465 [Chloracidobacterium thermophilum B]|uniref:Uncharacterized protein n=1 Tax=Chloracidobacterium thermophilum (strain B) TaxID=981222 RepID=G2LI10_CHLTF|nr:hypothetical protein Cabther_A0465 [Chloracidobacterium thermophilum B]